MSIGDLRSKLQVRISEERETLEQIAKSEFESLRRSLSESSRNALATIENDITSLAENVTETVSSRLQRLEQQTGKLQKAMIASWLKSVALGACLMIGMALGAWGLSEATSSYMESQWNQITELRRQKVNLEKTISLLEQDTWGVQLLETREGRFIVLPKNATGKSGWTIGDRKAIKLEQ